MGSMISGLRNILNRKADAAEKPQQARPDQAQFDAIEGSEIAGNGTTVGGASATLAALSGFMRPQKAEAETTASETSLPENGAGDQTEALQSQPGLQTATLLNEVPSVTPLQGTSPSTLNGADGSTASLTIGSGVTTPHDQVSGSKQPETIDFLGLPPTTDFGEMSPFESGAPSASGGAKAPSATTVESESPLEAGSELPDGETEPYSDDPIEVPTTPPQLATAAGTVTENVAGGIVGTATGLTADPSSGITYSIDDGRFEVVGIQIKLKDGVALDFETDGDVIDIAVTATDGHGNSTTQTVSFTLEDASESIQLDDSGVTFADEGVAEQLIDGGAGDDRIFGSNSDDDLQGNDGNDVLDGGGGDDSLAGGAGEDTLTGGIGNDTLTGGEDADELFGGEGSDTLDGGAGNDDLQGEDGDDSLDGGDGDDSLAGGAGEDTLTGGIGNDTLTGGEDADELFGGEGSDTLDGGAGNDDLQGEDGDDSLDGGDGDDSLAGGAGEDTLTGGIGNDTLTGGEDADELFGGEGSDTLDGGAGNDDLQGEDGDDSLDGGDGDDSLAGGAGEDTLTGGIGNDTLTGGEDADELFGGEGSDTLDGGAGNDDLQGEDGDDSLDGGDGDDSLSGGIGADTLAGGSGDDSLSGGDDADTFIVEDGFGNDTIIGGDGGTDDDVIDLSNLTGSVTVTYTSDEAGTITHGTDTITFSEIEQLILNEQADVVDATADGAGVNIETGGGNDTLYGGAGADYLEGGDDADTFIVEDGFGNDTIAGGEGGTDDDVIDLSGLTGPVTVTYTGDEEGTITHGTDTITFSEVERLILTDQADVVDATADGVGVDIGGGAGNDTIIGGSGDDTLHGGDGADSLHGGDGNDVIHTGDNGDTVDGGEGSDAIFLDRVSRGVDNVIQDTGTTGTDTLYLSDGAGGGYEVQWNFSYATSGIEVIDASAQSGERLESDAAAINYDFTGITLIGLDHIDGTSGQDTIIGSVASDYMEGDAGADSLVGAAGSDTILGGRHNDTITGGSGDDSLSGGDDADTFIVEDGFGNDTIAGGDGGTDDDVIDLSGLTGSINVTFTGDEEGTITDGDDTISFSEIENLVLSNEADVVDATSDSLGVNIDSGAGNDTVQGGSGQDTLQGGSGDDSLSGEDGSDTFIVRDGFGNDTITGGEGGTDDDVIDLSGLTGPVTVTYTGDESGTITHGTDTITFSEVERLILTDQADVVDATADGVNIHVDVGGGNDTIEGSSGNDVITALTDDSKAEAGTDAVLLMTFDDKGSTAADSSGNARDGVYQGDATPGATGWTGADTAVSLDGSGDYVEVPADTAYALDAGTISIRFNADEVSGRQTIFSRDSSYFDGGGHVTAWLQSDGSVEVRLQSDSGSTYLTSDPGAVSADTWAHVAFSFGPDGAALFVDGVQVDTDSYTGGISGNNEPWTLGASQWQSSDGQADNLKDHFEGAIDEFVIFDHQLDQTEVATLESEGATGTIATQISGGEGDDQLFGGDGSERLYGDAGNDSIDGGAGDDRIYGGDEVGADAVILMNFDDAGGTATDESGNNRDGAYRGNASPGKTGWNGEDTAVILDGSGDYVELRPDNAYELEAGTVSIRINANDLNSKQSIFSRDSMNYDGGGHISAWLNTDGSIEIRLQSDSGNTYLRSDAGSVDAGDWSHVAFSFGPDGAALFVDGAQVDADSYTGGLDGNNEPWTLGASQNRSGDGVADNLRDYFDGAIDEFAVFDYQLDSTEVAAIESDGITTGGHDKLHGGDGNDYLTGGGGDDSLSGGDGDDTIQGDGGNDTLSGGAGDDILDGGAGENTFLVAASEGSDTITGGESGWTQTIELADTAAGASVAGNTVTGDGWTMVLDTGSSVVSQNASALELSEDAGGVITFDSGGTVEFSEIDQITW